MEFLTILLITIGGAVFLTAVIACAMQHGRFALSPFFWRDIISYRALRDKRIGPSPARWGYVKLHEDRHGAVWELPESVIQRALPFAQNSTQRELLRSRRRIVEVVDPTTQDRYYLCVPMIAQTSIAKGAVAWTFALPTNTYDPLLET